MTKPVSYKRYRFPPQIIAHAVWLYFEFPLSPGSSRRCCSSAVSSSPMRPSSGGGRSLNQSMSGAWFCRNSGA